jgi:CheY-like chemotaxis protein
MKKILIIEDNPELREVLSRELELMGFEPITAQNGKEGVEKAASEKPHLVVLDILMPEMDGREAAQILRANPQTKDIPILAATVLFRDSDVQSCLQAGCNDYVVKPFTYALLEKKIRALFEEKACFLTKPNNRWLHV